MTFSKKIKLLFDAKERRQMLLLLIGCIVMGLLEVVGIASIVPFMAIVANPEMIHKNHYLSTAYQYFGFTNDNRFLMGGGIVALVMLGVSNFYSSFMIWWMTYYSTMQGHRLSVRLLKQYLSQSYLFFVNRNTADLGKNVLTEVDRIISGVLMPGMQAISKLISVLFIFAFLLMVNPFLAISAILVLSVCYLLIFSFGRHRLNRLGIASTDAVLQRFKIASETMSGIKDLKLHGGEMELLRRFSIPSEKLAKCTAQSLLITQLPRYTLETIAFGGILLIVIYLIANNLNSSQAVPLLAIYAMAGYRLMPAFQQIYYGLSSVRYHLPVLDIVAKDLSGDIYGKWLQDIKLSELPFKKSLQFESARFCYPNVEDPVIADLNLHITHNTTVGLVGETGSGKTTLVDILIGLLSLESGKLLVDGVEITQENLSAWQKNIGYVPQSIYLTDDTIARNIAFAIPDYEIDMEQVILAAKLAGLDDFVQTLPAGYQSPVGERGVKLSGGQLQRIGVARALYRNPNVLVLDEATSSLDGITENIVMNAIQNFSRKKTIVIIAHRLTTVRECDVIHLMDKGRIVESGNYDELLKHNEKFRKMAQM